MVVPLSNESDQIKDPILEHQDWGLIDYEEALKKQLELVDFVHKNNHPGIIIFCTHPPVITKGRATKEEDIFDWHGPTVEVSRGGRATYHGPNQLVVYPIVNLNFPRHRRKEKEVVGLIRDLEQAIIDTLEVYGINSEGKSFLKSSITIEDGKEKLEDTGVWVNSLGKIQKITSIGMAVKNWVSYHGAAINVFFDSKAFQGMNPCGYKSNTMVSLEEILNYDINLNDFKSNLLRAINNRI